MHYLNTRLTDTALLATNKFPSIVSNNLHLLLNSLQVGLNRWQINANESKSTHVTYTLHQDTCPAVTLNNQELPREDLGIHLDRCLTWKKKHFYEEKTTCLAIF